MKTEHQDLAGQIDTTEPVQAGPPVAPPPISQREALRTIILARWASGATSTVIADEINDAYGATLPWPMTRSAVMGIVNRAGMQRKRKPRLRRPAPATGTTPPTTPAAVTRAAGPPMICEPLPPEDVADVEPRRVPLVALETAECRWPYGDPRAPDFGFCGHPVAPGRPYCVAHARVARAKPRVAEVAR